MRKLKIEIDVMCPYNKCYYDGGSDKMRLSCIYCYISHIMRDTNISITQYDRESVEWKDYEKMFDIIEES